MVYFSVTLDQVIPGKYNVGTERMLEADRIIMCTILGMMIPILDERKVNIVLVNKNRRPRECDSIIIPINTYETKILHRDKLIYTSIKELWEEYGYLIYDTYKGPKSNRGYMASQKIFENRIKQELCFKTLYKYIEKNKNTGRGNGETTRFHFYEACRITEKIIIKVIEEGHVDV